MFLKNGNDNENENAINIRVVAGYPSKKLQISGLSAEKTINRENSKIYRFLAHNRDL